MNTNERKKGATKAQSLYVTLVVLLMSVAAIVAIGGAVAKNTKKSNTPPAKDTQAIETTISQKEDTEKPLETEDTKKAEDAVIIPDETTEASKEEPQETAPVVQEKPQNTLPTFSAPCQGAVNKGHSDTVPVFSNTMEDWRTHKGVDISATPGDKVCAAAGGVISSIWDDPMMGKSITITHTGGATTTYSNLMEELPLGIEKDATVNGGDIIGAVGETALCEIADESHLHFEMTVANVSVDPTEYIKFVGEADYEG